MSVELHPIDLACPMKCRYCYQEPMREALLPAARADAEAMLAAAARQSYSKGGHFTLFGGEPLAAPMPLLERLWAEGFARHRGNGVQTSGAIWSEEHLQLFEKYRVAVGLSLDGPGELNDARAMRSGGLPATRAATARSETLLSECLARKITVNVITVLSRPNASPERIQRLVDWYRTLDGAGVASVGLHVMERDSPLADEVALTEDETVAALLALREAELGFSGLRFGLFSQMIRLLRGQDAEILAPNGATARSGVSCIWNGCDPRSTPAVQGIAADGSLGNCQRTNKDGTDWLKAPDHGMERQLVLMQTPYGDGGCAGCRFWLMCKGQCPGDAIDGDWRNRSANCRVWFRVFEALERDLWRVGAPVISRASDRQAIEAAAAAEWAAGRKCTVERAAALARKKPTSKVAQRGQNDDHGDHEDHGDHNDVAAWVESIEMPGEVVE